MLKSTPYNGQSKTKSFVAGQEGRMVGEGNGHDQSRWCLPCYLISWCEGLRTPELITYDR